MENWETSSKIMQKTFWSNYFIHRRNEWMFENGTYLLETVFVSANTNVTADFDSINPIPTPKINQILEWKRNTHTHAKTLHIMQRINIEFKCFITLSQQYKDLHQISKKNPESAGTKTEQQARFGNS